MIANKSNKAIVLIATIATLAVISVIVMFFAQSSMFERRIASNDNLERQAKLVATASIEWAASYIPKLAMGADERTKKDDGSYEINSKAYSSVADFYQFKVFKKEDDDSKKKYDPHCPVEEHYSPDTQFNYKYRGTPSFHYENKESGLPYEYSYRQNFDTNMVALPTKHNPRLDNKDSKGTPRWTVHSTLKCVDANAFWNINSPIVGKRSKKNYNTMVKTLLSVIFKNEDNDTTIDVDDIDIDEVTNAWVEVREDKEKEGGEEEEEEQKEKKSKFENLGEFRIKISSKLKEKKKKGLTQQQLDKLCRYITVDSWGNKKSFRYGEKYTNYNKDYDKEDNHSTDSIKETRYPININVASKEILTVVFNQITTKSGKSIGYSEAKNLADKIVRERTPDNENDRNTLCFKTWNEVEKYLYDYFGNNKKDQAEAIFAVIYPGMLPNDKSPNRAQYRKFDKGDIEVGTTECCLFSPGVFYCEAIGRVIEYNKKPYTVLAHSKVSVNMKLWEPYIVNSQSDFESQRDKNLDPEKVAAWSSIEGGYTPYDDTYKHKVSAGFIQERGYWNFENSQDETYPDACRFWSWTKENPDAFEKRVDGIYMRKDEEPVPGILEEAYEIKTGSKDNPWNDSEWNANKWGDDGFDLWIKPSYDNGNKADEPLKDPVLIAVKKEEAKTLNNYPCHILTRCAYDVDSEPYLTISRTLVINNPPGTFKKREGNNFRIFYNSTIIERVKEVSSVRKNLYLAGYKIFGLFLAYVQKLLYGSSARVDFTKSRRESSVIFSENFSNQVYRAIMQEDESVLIKDFVIYTKDHGQTNPYTIGLRVYLPFKGANITQDKERWCHSKIEKCEGTPNLFKSESDRNFVFIGDEGAVFILEYLFQQKNALPINQEITITFDTLPNDPLIYYGYVSRSSQQKEATELDWFPGKNDPDEPINIDVPIQTEYKYSRTESRIPITLYKGCWYHIHARWKKDKILLTDFKVHYKKDGNEITCNRGKLYKHLFGSPGRVWAIDDKDDYNQEERRLYPKENNKTCFYCNNCVISFSHYRTQNKAWRYWSDAQKSSIYTGNFHLGNMYNKHPNYFYYGTVAWTQFAPENKNHNNNDVNNNDKEPNGAIFNIINDTTKFYSWGEEANSSRELENPNSIFMKEYSKNKDILFQFELHDKVDDTSASHLETTIVDRVVLYMIVQPQPLHWSHNIYKDQK